MTKFKMGELLTRVNEIKPDIIALTEILPKNTKEKASDLVLGLNINDYDMFINKNPMKRGVILYAHKNINARESKLNDDRFEESAWCEIEDANGDILLFGCTSIYRSPNTTEENTKLLLKLLRSQEISKYKKICITGDFNYTNLRWDGTWPENDQDNEFVESLRDAFLTQMVRKPTRCRDKQASNILDLVLISDEDMISDIEHCDPIGKSDHDTLNFQLYIPMRKTDYKKKYKFVLSKGNYNGMRDEIDGMDWNMLESRDVEEAWKCLKDTVHKLMHKYVPKTEIKPNGRVTPSWMTRKAMRLIKKKYNTYKRFLRTKLGQDYQEYITARNKSTNEVKRAKRNYERKVATECKKNPKTFWKYVKESTKQRTGIGVLTGKNGQVADTDKKKAETLNEFFASVFTRETLDNVPDLELGSKASGRLMKDNIDFSPEMIEKKLKELNPNKAQGPDEIPARVLKELSKELATPISMIFKSSLEKGEVPRDWKSAEVTAIFKKGNKSDPGNYRPVSLTCILCKVMESCIRDEIVNHFTVNNLYADCQHGFRNKRSCVTQLLQVMEEFSQLIDEGNPVDVVYLDFKKAFDSVPHERLLRKLSAYGVGGKTNKWIRSFLTDRVQRVRVGDEYSGMEKVLSGIPQGSILGPVLFTIFINDLPEAVKSKCKIFADDTKIYGTPEEGDEIQRDLTRLQEWSGVWNLYFNVNKCKVMHIGKGNPARQYTMTLEGDERVIETCTTEKDLGVTFDALLNFDAHINSAIGKANRMLGLIKRAFDYLTRESFLKLYKALVRPHLEYGNAVWHPRLIRQSVALEKVQRRATRLLGECRDMDYKRRLQYLGLHSLKGRRIRGDLIEIYKIFNSMVDLRVKDMFQQPGYTSTRNSDCKIYNEQWETKIRKFTLRYRNINHWNTLTNSLKHAESTNKFKNTIDGMPKFQQMFLEFDGDYR
jgi:hypothetical protein